MQLNKEEEERAMNKRYERTHQKKTKAGYNRGITENTRKQADLEELI